MMVGDELLTETGSADAVFHPCRRIGVYPLFNKCGQRYSGYAT